QCGEENDRDAGVVAQTRRGRGSCSLFPIPYSLNFHGNSRKVWRVWAATAAGVKGSAKVVPPYQSFHWSWKYGLSGLPLSPSTMFSVEPSMLLQSMVK